MNIQNISVYKNFGTAALYYNDIKIEFNGARKESYQKLSRNPKVKKGSIEDDQKRRDFTINAMAVSLSKKNYGDFFDPFNGMKDIEEKLGVNHDNTFDCTQPILIHANLPQNTSQMLFQKTP